ncbi:hypothetical protein NPIL_581561, partial [Nephila pilipes]
MDIENLHPNFPHWHNLPRDTGEDGFLIAELRPTGNLKNIYRCSYINKEVFCCRS